MEIPVEDFSYSQQPLAITSLEHNVILQFNETLVNSTGYMIAY